MADTGAPWNIPYVEPTDLVREYPAADEAQANAIAAGLTAAGNAGIGSNVVQTVKTDVFTASVAQGAQTAITGLSATITPTTDTSRILVLVSITHGSTAGGNSAGQWFTLNRGGTDIFIGDADGSRTRVSSGSTASGSALLDDSLRNTQIMFLDFPATTSATTYGIDGGHNAASTQPIGVNRSRTDNNASNYTRGASSITLIEVAA